MSSDYHRPGGPKPTSFWRRISTNYDPSFIANLACLYVNGGCKVFYSVALQEILRVKYKLSPTELQVAFAFIMFPWDFKILYGIICDTVKLPFFADSPKRGYLMLFALLQGTCLAVAGANQFPGEDGGATLVWLFFVCSLCGAFMDCVIDGVTCI